MPALRRRRVGFALVPHQGAASALRRHYFCAAVSAPHRRRVGAALASLCLRRVGAASASRLCRIRAPRRRRRIGVAMLAPHRRHISVAFVPRQGARSDASALCLRRVDATLRRFCLIAFGGSGGLRRRARGYAVCRAAALVEGSRAVMRMSTRCERFFARCIALVCESTGLVEDDGVYRAGERYATKRAPKTRQGDQETSLYRWPGQHRARARFSREGRERPPAYELVTSL